MEVVLQRAINDRFKQIIIHYESYFLLMQGAWNSQHSFVRHLFIDIIMSARLLHLQLIMRNINLILKRNNQVIITK